MFDVWLKMCPNLATKGAKLHALNESIREYIPGEMRVCPNTETVENKDSNARRYTMGMLHSLATKQLPWTTRSAQEWIYNYAFCNPDSKLSIWIEHDKLWKI